MNLKTIGLTISAVSVAWLGLSQEAQAAKFNENDRLNINLPAFQINAAGLVGNDINGDPITFPLLPTGEVNGGADGLADALFGRYDPPGSVKPQDTTLTFNDRVMNHPGTTIDYVPGDVGNFLVGASVGGFKAYEGEQGFIRAFDGFTFAQLNEVNGGFAPPATDDDVTNDLPDGLFPDNYLLQLTTTSAEVRFYLTEITPFSLPGALSSGFTNIEGKGWLLAKNDDADVDFYRVSYSLTAPDVVDNGVQPSDPVAGDGVTSIQTAAASSLVVSIDRQDIFSVPEPSTLVGLVAVGGAGLLARRNKLKQK